MRIRRRVDTFREIEEPPETGFRRDLVLRGLIVAMVQATAPRTRNNTTPNC